VTKHDERAEEEHEVGRRHVRGRMPGALVAVNILTHRDKWPLSIVTIAGPLPPPSPHSISLSLSLALSLSRHATNDLVNERRIKIDTRG